MTQASAAINPWARKAVVLRTRAVLIAAATWWQEHRYPPSNRDLQEICGISSPSVVKYHLDKLRKAQLIEFIAGAPRTLVLTPAGWRAASIAPPRLDEEPH